MRCYYDVLDLDRDQCTSTDIKRAYRKLALRYHPDKHSHKGTTEQEEVKHIFLEIQKAYEVLSDEQERAFYDSHREFILRGKDGAQADYGPSKLYSYFSSACYNDYDDSQDGFYSVYREIFALIDREEAEFAGNDRRAGESFGKSDTDYDDVISFYATWAGFSTKKTFNWMQKYDISDAENRRIRRIVERENKKEADKGKKEYNDVVRKLVQFVKRRDPRVQAYLEILAEEKEQKELERIEKEERDKVDMLKRRQQLLDEHYEQYQDIYDNVSEEHSEEKPIEVVVDDLYCIACKKKFKSEGSWKQHEKSKKHKQKMNQMRKEVMIEDDFQNQDLKEDVSVPLSSKDLNGDIDEQHDSDRDIDEQQFEASIEEIIIVEHNSDGDIDGKQDLNRDINEQQDLNGDIAEQQFEATIEEIAALEQSEDSPLEEGVLEDSKNLSQNSEIESRSDSESSDELDYVLMMMNASPNRKNKKVYEALREHEEEIKKVKERFEIREEKKNNPPPKRRRNKKKKNPPLPKPEKKQEYTCKKCGEKYESRNKLFEHLGESGCFIPPKGGVVKNASRGKRN